MAVSVSLPSFLEFRIKECYNLTQNAGPARLTTMPVFEFSLSTGGIINDNLTARLHSGRWQSQSVR